jgi:hypothetical protein
VHFPAQQQTLLEQLCEPEQSIPQVEAEQVKAPWHDCEPVQLAVIVLPLSAAAPAQEPFPEQVNAHESPEQARSLAHAPSPVQLIWFLAAWLVTPLLQAFVPPQATVHELPAQLTEPAHELDSAHAMSQPAARLQSIPFAHPPCPQVIWQESWDGQVTTDAQEPAALQSITHLSSV